MSRISRPAIFIIHTSCISNSNRLLRNLARMSSDENKENVPPEMPRTPTKRAGLSAEEILRKRPRKLPPMSKLLETLNENEQGLSEEDVLRTRVQTFPRVFKKTVPSNENEPDVTDEQVPRKRTQKVKVPPPTPYSDNPDYWQQVKEYYLHKPKVNPKKFSTKLETIYEEPAEGGPLMGPKKISRMIKFHKPHRVRKSKIRQRQHQVVRHLLSIKERTNVTNEDLIWLMATDKDNVSEASESGNDSSATDNDDDNSHDSSASDNGGEGSAETFIQFGHLNLV